MTESQSRPQLNTEMLDFFLNKITVLKGFCWPEYGELGKKRFHTYTLKEVCEAYASEKDKRIKELEKALEYSKCNCDVDEMAYYGILYPRCERCLALYGV